MGSTPARPIASADARPSRSSPPRVVVEGWPERAPVHLAPGRIVPGTRYRILRWLGEGGMGVVYEAEHADVGRRFAVKVLREQYCAHPEAVDGFRREARVTTEVGSENIVQIYDFAELPDGRLLIAMELVDGRPLVDDVGRSMDPARVIGILRQVCRGLAAAHAVGVIHRDIKPENVYLARRDGRPDFVKLFDFGIATVVEADFAYRSLVGTPSFVAPEMISSGEVGPATDIYAVGCMAYEMLTGIPAFDGPTVTQVLDAHLHVTPPRPSSACSTVPAALDKVVMRCLAKSPRDRFADMADLEAALCEAQIEAGIVTAWDDLPLPDIEAGRRDRLLARMPEPETLSRRASRSTILVLLAMAVLALLAAAVGGWALLREPEPSSAMDVVDTKAREAREAAARAAFIYPPADDPGSKTAFRLVRELEELGGAARKPGRERAQALREEFAATLVRLGDEYWAADGGKPFAIRYYAQALLFVPDIEPAVERADLGEHELAALENKAAANDFDEDELVDGIPLAALAQDDPEKRAEGLAAYRRERREQQARRDAELDELAGIDEGPAPAPARPSASARTPEDALLPPTAGSNPDADAPIERDPKAARALARQARQALGRGDAAEAQRLYDRALAQDRRNVAALAGLRDLAFDRGDYGRAVKYGERVVALVRRDAEHHLRLGDAYYKVLRYADALGEYQQAQKLGDERAGWRLDKTRAKLGK